MHILFFLIFFFNYYFFFCFCNDFCDFWELKQRKSLLLSSFMHWYCDIRVCLVIICLNTCFMSVLLILNEFVFFFLCTYHTVQVPQLCPCGCCHMYSKSWIHDFVYSAHIIARKIRGIVAQLASIKEMQTNGF